MKTLRTARKPPAFRNQKIRNRKTAALRLKPVPEPLAADCSSGTQARKICRIPASFARAAQHCRNLFLFFAKKGLLFFLRSSIDSLQLGKVAQLVRACGSYPQCREFKSPPCYHFSRSCGKQPQLLFYASCTPLQHAGSGSVAPPWSPAHHAKPRHTGSRNGTAKRKPGRWQEVARTLRYRARNAMTARVTVSQSRLAMHRGAPPVLAQS